MGARVVAIADAYDAMTHDRPYRMGLAAPEALDELRRTRGLQFDPQLVDLLLDILNQHGSAEERFADAGLARAFTRGLHAATSNAGGG